MPEVIGVQFFWTVLTLYDHGIITGWGVLFLLAMFGGHTSSVRHK